MKNLKHNEEYLLMKTTDILAKLLDDDYQKQDYNEMISRVEARFLIRDIENYFKQENK